MVVSSRMLTFGCYRGADAVEFCAGSPERFLSTSDDSKRRNRPPGVAARRTLFAPAPGRGGRAAISASAARLAPDKPMVKGYFASGAMPGGRIEMISSRERRRAAQ